MEHVNERTDLLMSRRRLLSTLGTGMLAVALPAMSEAEREIELSMGSQDESHLPDTLDLANRAKLAINAITRCTDAKEEYAVYFYTNLYRNPPTMIRKIPLYGKFMEGLALARLMTGDNLNQHVDGVWEQAFLRVLNNQNPVLTGPEGGRQLAWMAIQYKTTKEPTWKDLGERAIHRILEAASHRDDYCYLPYDSEGRMPTGWGATFQGWTLQGVTQFYNATGSSTALELAGKLARYLKNHAEVIDASGRFLARHGASIPYSPASVFGPALHFHHNGNTMEALMEYAMASGEVEFSTFVKISYEYARALADASSRIGFFPEYIDDWPDDRNLVDCEACCVVDMLLTALWLTKAGVGDYWDDIDRYLRNQFAEMQMTSADWISQMTDELRPGPIGVDEVEVREPERCVGSFAGWSTANDFYAGAGNGIMHCCTGNGARALYYLWDNMLELEKGELRLHLLLNRVAPWAEVISFIPHRGRVDLRIRQDCARVSIRIPEWITAQHSSLCCRINGSPHKPIWEGRYIILPGRVSGDTIQITFPIPERTVEEKIGNVRYTLTLRGNNVIEISPPGNNYPFYQEKKTH